MHAVNGSGEATHDVMGGFGACHSQLVLEGMFSPLHPGMIPLTGGSTELSSFHVGLGNDLTSLIRVHLFDFQEIDPIFTSMFHKQASPVSTP